MASLWDVEGNDLDVGYLNIREAAACDEQQIRDALDALWECYEPYADPDFRYGFASDPDGRFWEMYLGYRLLRAGKTLLPTVQRQRDGGQPDICVIDGDQRVWIEAIAPDRGQPGPDQVQGPVPINEGGGVEPAPIRQARLRITSALWTKTQAIARYLEEKVIADEDSRLIAIGAGRFGAYVPEDPIPLVLSAVFPIGDEYVTVDIETGNITDQGFHPSFEIDREAGAIPQTAFLDEQFSQVSGLIWSRISIGNMSQKVRPTSFVHNPLAAVPMQQNWGVWDREFLLNENEQQITDILMTGGDEI